MGFAGGISIDQRNLLAINRHAVGKGILIEMKVFAAGDLWFGGAQVPRFGVIPHPSMQFMQRRDVFEVSGIKIKECLIEVHRRATQASLPILYLFAQRTIGCHEPRLCRRRGGLHGPHHGPFIVPVKIVVSSREGRRQKIVFDQRRPDEKDRGFAGRNSSVSDLTGKDLQAMEGGFLLDHHPASTGTPMRVQVGHLAEMRR